MSFVRLPILTLAVREQRYSCHGCGNCCRDFTVQLRAEDIAHLRDQKWEERLGERVTVEFRGQTYLRQREDGACVFLMENGLCRIHHEFGFEAKPIACQLFPFHLTPGGGISGGAGGGGKRGMMMGINFACQSVLENKGAALPAHEEELRRMTERLPELAASQPPTPLLSDRLRGEPREIDALTTQIDRWLRRTELPLTLRIDGLAWVAGSLAKAKLENVRGERFDDLLHVLFTALPDELAHHPIDPPTKRQRRMLRQAVFARTEDPKLSAIEKLGRLRITWRQLRRSGRFKSGRGIAPKIGAGWPETAPMGAIETIAAAREPQQVAAIEDLMTRYLRASVLGGRTWGAGYYGWSAIGGLQALLLNVAVIGWLARLHAAGRGDNSIDIVDVRAALGRVDRTAGRAKWLGGSGERLRLAYLNIDDGLRRLLAAYPLQQS